MTIEYRHIPVMLDEVMNFFKPQQGAIFVDCTLGGAGHSLKIANELGRDGLLVGIDQDCDARAVATKRLNGIEEAKHPEIHIVDANFSQLDEVLVSIPVPRIDYILFDLGISSYQIDEKDRGFTYKLDSKLDMRMNPSADCLTAEDLVNSLEEEELAEILVDFGEEKYAKRIAKNICDARKVKPIKTSGELVALIREAIPVRARRTTGHPAKRTFQALRIAVNDELEVLKKALSSAISWLNVGGKICVISYHSLEDRIVKETFRSYEDRCECDPSFPVCTCGKLSILKCTPKGVIKPTDSEIEANSRARSAKMRCAVKIN